MANTTAPLREARRFPVSMCPAVENCVPVAIDGALAAAPCAPPCDALARLLRPMLAPFPFSGPRANGRVPLALLVARLRYSCVTISAVVDMLTPGFPLTSSTNAPWRRFDWM